MDSNILNCIHKYYNIIYIYIIGELHHLAGNISINGRIAYVPQSSWIPNQSLKDVILFNKPYNQKEYDDIIKICALEKDVMSFESGIYIYIYIIF